MIPRATPVSTAPNTTGKKHEHSTNPFSILLLFFFFISSFPSASLPLSVLTSSCIESFAPFFLFFPNSGQCCWGPQVCHPHHSCSSGYAYATVPPQPQPASQHLFVYPKWEHLPQLNHNVSQVRRKKRMKEEERFWVNESQAGIFCSCEKSFSCFTCHTCRSMNMGIVLVGVGGTGAHSVFSHSTPSSRSLSHKCSNGFWIRGPNAMLNVQYMVCVHTASHRSYVLFLGAWQHWWTY